MMFRTCGRSGLRLPTLSLGLWHNFGEATPYETAKALALRAFDLGITHFDLANNYGPPPGSAELTFRQILDRELGAHRDELIISTKAGYVMGPGPYGDGGSRKSLVSSLDASLKRIGLDYVDIYYHHRPDPDTPLEETMTALDHLVRQGKALYVGVSNYDAERTARAVKILQDLGTPCLIHQVRYSMFDRGPESALFATLRASGVGCIAFSPLAKGLLTDRYLNGIPADSRAAGPSMFLQPDAITAEKTDKVRHLNRIAERREQSMAQLALAWVLRDPVVTSALIGASRPDQIDINVASLKNLALSASEIQEIETILA